MTAGFSSSLGYSWTIYWLSRSEKQQIQQSQPSASSGLDRWEDQPNQFCCTLELLSWCRRLKKIISRQQGIFIPSEVSGNLCCCRNIWWKNMLILGSERIASSNYLTGEWIWKSSSVPFATADRPTLLVLSLSSVSGWRVMSNLNLSLYLVLTFVIKSSNHLSITFWSEGIHWPIR